jgi:DNA-directed RNA polymerase I, II, and III subunit RPABC5
MIIPIKCFTCGKVIADKYNYYVAKVREEKTKQGVSMDKVTYLTKDDVRKTPEGQILDELGLDKQCCRRHMMTHVDIE